MTFRAPIFVVSVILLGACGAQAPRTDASADSSAAPTELFSEPEEYRARPVSAEAGERYFSELGVGDPYGAGIAYPVLRGLMSLRPDLLGSNMDELSTRFGFVSSTATPHDPEALPVGFHVTRDPNTGVDFVVNNCQVCHASRVRTEAGEQVVPGIGNREVRIHAYAAAFARLATDPEVDEGALRRATDAEASRLSLRWPSSYRDALVKASLREMRRRFGPARGDLERLAEGLPGRVATMEGFMVAFNMFRGAGLGLPDTVGWARIPDVAPFRYRETNSFDAAAIGDPVVLVAEADFAFGARPRWYESHRHIATSMFLYLRGFERNLPFPGPIDRALATQGFERFEARCAGCHGHYARPGEPQRVSYRERVVPIDVVGTDRARLDALTDAMVEVANAVHETSGLVLTRRTGGYVPPVLVDVWARGQYGHNGQWPDLEALATAPEARPQRFVVAPRAPFDLARVGQRWRAIAAGDTPAPDAAAGEYVYDASAPGNGTGGHPFLSDLAPDGRRAVIEYLKTL